jgi:hypothetical protein
LIWKRLKSVLGTGRASAEQDRLHREQAALEQARALGADLASFSAMVQGLVPLLRAAARRHPGS